MPTLLSLLTTALALSSLQLSSVQGHGYLTQPVGRVQAIWGDTKGNQNCRVHTKGNVTEFKAGEVIQVRHTRNNHIGGFIRYSISPFGNETTADFDDSAFYYTCREAGDECRPKNGNATRYAGDAAHAYVVLCGDTIKLPDWLPAGDYVLQWTWFGVGSSYSKLGMSEPQFRSCADIRLTTSGTKSKPACPTFVGGDRVAKQENKGDDVCLYFHTNDIANAIFETDDYEKEYKFGVPAPVAKCLAEKGSAGKDDTANEADDETTPSASGPPAPTATPVSSTPTPTEAPTPATTPTSKCKAV